MQQGFTCFQPNLKPEELRRLRESAFRTDRAGTRCLLDTPAVRATALGLKEQLTEAGLLPGSAVAIQAIAFDKTPDTNWKVSWHQDLVFPFAAPVSHPGFTQPTVKDGVNYARLSRDVLEAMTAVRLHLDECDERNGPLRISPGSHTRGIIPTSEIPALVHLRGESVCVAGEGEALLMKPLALHASSQAVTPRHRRVLHFVYYSGLPLPEKWHRTV